MADNETMSEKELLRKAQEMLDYINERDFDVREALAVLGACVTTIVVSADRELGELLMETFCAKLRGSFYDD